MKIELELSHEQIQSYIDFYRLGPNNHTVCQNAREVLSLLDEAFSIALMADDTPNPDRQSRRSGRAKLLWQANETIETAALHLNTSHANSPLPAYQDPQKTGSVSFWSWVAANQSKN